MALIESRLAGPSTVPVGSVFPVTSENGRGREPVASNFHQVMQELIGMFDVCSRGPNFDGGQDVEGLDERKTM